jgi:mRNA-degrading endonuclease toxin of MazEF toxin-antitoxin module
VVAVVDQIRAVSKQRLERRIEMLDPDDFSRVEEGLREILELA